MERPGHRSGIVGRRVRAGCVVVYVLLASAAGIARGDAGAAARQILDATCVRGGLVVHVGCGDGKLTAALRAGDSYLVHGLDADAAKIARAREHLRRLGPYGPVSVERHEGKRLPYTDNLVNLLVGEDLGGAGMAEVLRVLAPGGVAYVRADGGWRKTVKPRPAGIDEWTHYLYDATNNAVSRDTVVGPPKHMQWVSEPAWARSHDHLASISAAVVASGRLFHIADEGPPAAIVLDPNWVLTARDAFSGVLLWRRRIASWQYHLRGFRSGPAELPRRLVAVGDRVYVTLGIDEPVSVLDAATGRTLSTWKGTAAAIEFVHDAGRLFVVVGDPAAQRAAAREHRRGEKPGFVAARPQRPDYGEKPPLKRLTAIDSASGRVLWTKADADTTELMPTALAAAGGRVYVQNPDEILCLAAATGTEVWRAKRPLARRRPTWSAPTLVVHDEVILSGDRAVAQRKKPDPNDPRKTAWYVTSAGGRSPMGELIAFSASDGKRLWAAPCRECYNAPADVLVVDGLVWTGQLVRAREPGITRGLDPETGAVKRTRPKDQAFFQPGMSHHRCHRNRGAGRHLVLGRAGVEFIDVTTGRAQANHWVRGGCQYGVIPCNGLLYAPSHSCACFITAKIHGFNCLAPKRVGRANPPKPSERLERGKAYGQKVDRPLPAGGSPAGDWPTYRHDAARSGRTASAPPANLHPAWTAKLAGRLSSVTVADGRLFVAQIDAQTVHALRASDGSRLWHHTAGGRVDSPPTLWRGRVLFGSADGTVTCLRASDGALIWRFRAAPEDRRVVAYGRLESAWPVHGSVLVRRVGPGGSSGAERTVVYAAAGRSSYLDGGIRLCRLDAASGRLLGETRIDHCDPNTGYQPKGVTKGTNIPGALPDVLSYDGTSVYMRHLRFDTSGRPQPADTPHLFSPAGFLDDAWWHRTYWLVGTAIGSNYGGWPRVGNQVPAGRLLAMDDASVYGFGRSLYAHYGGHVGLDGATVYHFRGQATTERRFTHYRAFAAERPVIGPAKGKAPGGRVRRGARRPRVFRWTQKLPILARAMVVAGDVLLLAGPPDLFACDDPVGALAGRRGGALVALAATDGKQLARCKLDAPPVLDGLVVAGQRVYLATTDGKVVCLAGRER